MKHLISLCCALLMLVACSKQPDNNIEDHKAAMKRFETMINTADSNIAKELIADDATFYTPASPTPLTAAKDIFQPFIGCVKAFPMPNGNWKKWLPKVMLS